nr:HypC/HybG/HupF family hydrogenase formation chaperone [uncultured Anaeromusa sp.]
MCLAVPAQIVKREDMLATVDVGGVQRQVSMLLLPEAQIGEYVLIHAGFAMQLIDEEEAKLTWSLLREMAEHVQDA